jgi:hypothetical protein
MQLIYIYLLFFRKNEIFLRLKPRVGDMSLPPLGSLLLFIYFLGLPLAGLRVFCTGITSFFF